jgi:Bcr/CflA subfamily drug resistance transporter
MKSKLRGSTFSSAMFLIAVLLVYPLPQFAIDLYAPSWVSMAHIFHVSHQQIQMTLTLYLFFLGFSQLIYGPLSDKYGRKPVLLFGCGLFLIASFACMFSKNIAMLYVFRALQGLGLGCGFTVASAILGDVFKGNRLAKMTSYSAMVYSLAVILAPLLGGYIQFYVGWTFNFLAMCIYAAVLFIMICFYVHETHPSRGNTKNLFKTSIKNYIHCFSNFEFMGNVLGLTLAYALIVALSTLAPFLLMNTMHVSEVMYGKLLGFVGLCYFVGASMNSRLISNYTLDTGINIGVFFMLIGSACLVFFTLQDILTPTYLIAFSSIAVFGVGFVYPNCFAKALDVFEEKGSAGAFLGSSGLVGTGVISLIIIHSHLDRAYCLSLSFLVLSVLCGVCCLIARKRQAVGVVYE